MDVEWTDVIGCEPDEFCTRLYASRPGWASGIVSLDDARYLFRRVLGAGTETVIEIGTASGVSTAYLVHALDFAGRAGNIGPDWTLLSYDIQGKFYADMVPSALMSRVGFRHPALALDVGKRHGADALDFLFIDANHEHPWPALDVLATLDSLRPGAEVVLHDVNLPVLIPDGACGAKHLFDDLDVEKVLDITDDIPNIGSLMVPEDKQGFREQVLAVVAAHEWEAPIPPEVSEPLLGGRS